MNLLKRLFLKIKWQGWLKLNKLVKEIEARLQGISKTPYLDALFFVEAYERQQKEITSCDVDDFVKRIQKKEPVSKIVGERGFWALDFKVTKDVLDPRPDSETIIESVLSYFKDKEAPLSILDIGTGSGCLLISLLYEYKNAKGIGVDISDKALEIAKENGANFNALFLKKDFFLKDFLKDLPLCDVIVSNPPYIPTNEIENLEENVRYYDPLLALDGGIDGLDAYRSLAHSLKHLLTPGGKIFFEIGKGQEQSVTSLMQDNGYALLEERKDLAGIIRVLVFSFEGK